MMRRGSRARISATTPGAVYLSSCAPVAGGWRGTVISDQNEVSVTQAAPRTEGTIRLWTLVAGVALVAGGLWLRTPSVGYLAFTVAATVATLGIVVLWGRGARRWAVASAAALGAFAVVATSSQRDLTRIDKDWPAYRALVVERGRAEFQREIAQALVSLQAKATRALDAPSDAEQAFA